MNVNVIFFSSYFYHLFKFSLVLSINLSIAVLHTLARNRTIGPAEPEAKRLPSSAPVCYDIANKPTFVKINIFPFFGFLHINQSLYTVSPFMSLNLAWTHCWLNGKFLVCVCVLSVCMYVWGGRYFNVYKYI